MLSPYYSKPRVEAQSPDILGFDNSLQAVITQPLKPMTTQSRGCCDPLWTKYEEKEMDSTRGTFMLWVANGIVWDETEIKLCVVGWCGGQRATTSQCWSSSNSCMRRTWNWLTSGSRHCHLHTSWNSSEIPWTRWRSVFISLLLSLFCLVTVDFHAFVKRHSATIIRKHM